MNEKKKRLLNIIKNESLGIPEETIRILNEDITKLLSEYFVLSDEVDIELTEGVNETKIAVTARATAIKNVKILD